jgi:anthranilate synthase component 1
MKTGLNYQLEDAIKLANDYNVIPVIRTLFSGTETPLSIYEKLAKDKPGSFLLESAEQGVWARFSFVGVTNRGFLSESADGSFDWISDQPPFPGKQQMLPDTALEAIEAMTLAWSSPKSANLPPLTSGLVGLIGWDAIRQIEKLGPAPSPDFESPTVAFAMFQDLVILDHFEGTLLLVSNLFIDAETDVAHAYGEAIRRLETLESGIKEPTQTLLADLDTSISGDVEYRVEKSEFFDAIEQAKHFVRIGDVFQVVISQRFDIELNASALDVYRVLRALNPSPYMYLLNFEDESGPYAVVGSSPESLVAVQDRHVVTHPIAGSRPRGNTPDHDLELADSLLEDHKEKAEHLMLVDLARNDLLKVCKPDSVSVSEFMQIHRYSHVMHLVSTVEGELRQDQTAVAAFKATFPAGTLSGAPKPRALEIIDELEVANRGLYGGVVGYFDFTGNADLAIAIRTAFLRNGRAHVQAGAGLVLDSVPESEYQETISKASAPLRAIAAANQMVKR